MLLKLNRHFIIRDNSIFTVYVRKFKCSSQTAAELHAIVEEIVEDCQPRDNNTY